MRAMVRRCRPFRDRLLSLSLYYSLIVIASIVISAAPLFEPLIYSTTTPSYWAALAFCPSRQRRQIRRPLRRQADTGASRRVRYCSTGSDFGAAVRLGAAAAAAAAASGGVGFGDGVVSSAAAKPAERTAKKRRRKKKRRGVKSTSTEGSVDRINGSDDPILPDDRKSKSSGSAGAAPVDAPKSEAPPPSPKPAPSEPATTTRRTRLCRRIPSSDAAELIRRSYLSKTNHDGAGGGGAGGERLLVVTTDASGGSARYHGLCAVLRRIDRAAAAAADAPPSSSASDAVSVISKRTRSNRPTTGGRSQRKSSRKSRSGGGSSGGRSGGGLLPPEIAASSLGLRSALDMISPEHRQAVVLLTDCERTIAYLERIGSTSTTSGGTTPTVRAMEQLASETESGLVWLAKVKSVSNSGDDGYYDHAAADLVSALVRGRSNADAGPGGLVASSLDGPPPASGGESGNGSRRGGESMGINDPSVLQDGESAMVPSLLDADLDWLERSEEEVGMKRPEDEGRFAGGVGTAAGAKATTLAQARQVGRVRISRLQKRLALEWGGVPSLQR